MNTLNVSVNTAICEHNEYRYSSVNTMNTLTKLDTINIAIWSMNALSKLWIQ